jgi:hypothetical protein
MLTVRFPYLQNMAACRGDLTAQPQRRGGMTVGIGFSLFLFVVGAILTFAVDVDSSGSGFNLNTVGVILLVADCLGCCSWRCSGAASRPGVAAGPWPVATP